MGHLIFIGWFRRETLAHCNTVHGYGLCGVSQAYLNNANREDWTRYGKLGSEMIEAGWKLCPRCNSKVQRGRVAEAENAIRVEREAENAKFID